MDEGGMNRVDESKGPKQLSHTYIGKPAGEYSRVEGGEGGR